MLRLLEKAAPPGAQSVQGCSAETPHQGLTVTPVTVLAPAQLVLRGGWQPAGSSLKLSHDDKPTVVIFHFLPFFI